MCTLRNSELFGVLQNDSANAVNALKGRKFTNIKVRRFTRYTLGEGIEVDQMDFATAVASMSAT